MLCVQCRFVDEKSKNWNSYRPMCVLVGVSVSLFRFLVWDSMWFFIQTVLMSSGYLYRTALNGICVGCKWNSGSFFHSLIEDFMWVQMKVEKRTHTHNNRIQIHTGKAFKLNGQTRMYKQWIYRKLWSDPNKSHN